MSKVLLAAVSVLLLSSFQPGPVRAQAEETPPAFKASAVLPRDILSGPSYSVDDAVQNDGYLNTYTIHSRYGDMRAASTALLYTRLSEIAALDKMAQVQATGAFGQSLADKGKQTLQGAVNLVTNPLGTVGGALSGVGKLFVRAHESLVESTPSQYEGNRFQNLIGYSQTKRDYAKQFGVDPYSTNPILQDRLNELSEAGYAGSITVTALQALIPGGVGWAVSGVSGSALLGEIDLSVPPTQLRKENRESLLKQGVPEFLARMFIDNDQFTPTQQTIIVRSLAAMADTRGKELFLEFAIPTSDQDLALFRQRMIQMFAAYDRTVARLDRFVRLGRFVGAVKADGRLVLAFPLDYLVCTGTNQDLIADANDQAKSLSVPGVELWLTGKASPQTARFVKRLKWKLEAESARKLLGTWY